MDLKKLTLGEIQNLDLKKLTLEEIGQLLGSGENNNMYQRYKGKYVIVRSYNEGVNAGYVLDLDDTGIILTRARRLWAYSPKDNSSWYEGVSKVGLAENSEISCEVEEKCIIEKYSITLCSKEAEESITSISSHKKS